MLQPKGGLKVYQKKKKKSTDWSDLLCNQVHLQVGRAQRWLQDRMDVLQETFKASALVLRHCRSGFLARSRISDALVSLAGEKTTVRAGKKTQGKAKLHSLAEHLSISSSCLSWGSTAKPKFCTKCSQRLSTRCDCTHVQKGRVCSVCSLFQFILFSVGPVKLTQRSH